MKVVPLEFTWENEASKCNEILPYYAVITRSKNTLSFRTYQTVLRPKECVRFIAQIWVSCLRLQFFNVHVSLSNPCITFHRVSFWRWCVCGESQGQSWEWHHPLRSEAEAGQIENKDRILAVNMNQHIYKSARIAPPTISALKKPQNWRNIGHCIVLIFY